MLTPPTMPTTLPMINYQFMTLEYYYAAWDQDQINDVFEAIQQSLDENPPDVGIDMYEELKKLQEYAELEVARTVGEFAPDTIYFNIDVDYEDTGYDAQATVRYVYDLGYNPMNPEAAEMYPGDEVEVQEEIDSTLTQDYYEADIGFETGDLVIDLTINADDTFGGPNREAREQAVVNTRDFIDGVMYSYGDATLKNTKNFVRNLLREKCSPQINGTHPRTTLKIRRRTNTLYAC